MAQSPDVPRNHCSRGIGLPSAVQPQHIGQVGDREAAILEPLHLVEALHLTFVGAALLPRAHQVGQVRRIGDVNGQLSSERHLPAGGHNVQQKNKQQYALDRHACDRKALGLSALWLAG